MWPTATSQMGSRPPARRARVTKRRTRWPASRGTRRRSRLKQLQRKGGHTEEESTSLAKAAAAAAAQAKEQEVAKAAADRRLKRARDQAQGKPVDMSAAKQTGMKDPARISCA